MSRCLYNSSFDNFIKDSDKSILGVLCDKYHGMALTTTREAWAAEISIMKDILSRIDAKEGQTLEDTVHREIVQERIIEQAGKISGIIAVQEVIRARRWDLMSMANDHSSYLRITPDDVERMAKDD